MHCLANSISVNKHLVSLGLEDNCFSSNGFTLFLHQLVGKNSVLSNIDIDDFELTEEQLLILQDIFESRQQLLLPPLVLRTLSGLHRAMKEMENNFKKLSLSYPDLIH